MKQMIQEIVPLVHKELRAYGLDKLCLTPVVEADSFFEDLASGWYQDRVISVAKGWGVKTGFRLAFSGFLGRLGVPPPMGFQDFLRHEFGHAVVEYGRVKSSQLPAFGHPPFVSQYAETDWEEDFCETFRTLLRQGPHGTQDLVGQDKTAQLVARLGAVAALERRWP